MRAYLLFEQSGTFKREFNKLGFEAFDYDIRNDFNETTCICDLFNQIDLAYEDKSSLFDGIKRDDIIMAFFPCTRFEVQISMGFRGDLWQQRNWDHLKKLEYAATLERERARFYQVISELAIVCIKRGLRLIIENPYSSQHYLTRYWSLKPSLIDMDRRKNGDYYKKPTQYWFINCEPQNNILFESFEMATPGKNIEDTHNTVQRSMISPTYAHRFIKQYILEEV